MSFRDTSLQSITHIHISQSAWISAKGLAAQHMGTWAGMATEKYWQNYSPGGSSSSSSWPALVVEEKKQGRRESVTSPLQLGSHLSWVFLVMMKISMVMWIRMVKMFSFLLVKIFEDVLTDHCLRCQGFVFPQCSQFDHLWAFVVKWWAHGMYNWKPYVCDLGRVRGQNMNFQHGDSDDTL